jgi:hypothetical protein
MTARLQNWHWPFISVAVLLIVSGGLWITLASLASTTSLFQTLQRQLVNAGIGKFRTVAMTPSSKEIPGTALEWRSVYAPSLDGNEASLISLNPSDENEPPIIFDVHAQKLIKVRQRPSSTGAKGETQAIELHAFYRGLAAARVTTNNKTPASNAASEQWGYVDDTGQWKLDPRYSWAGDFVNGVALVSVVDSPSRVHLAIIDTSGTELMSLGGFIHTSQWDLRPPIRLVPTKHGALLRPPFNRFSVMDMCNEIPSAYIEIKNGQPNLTHLPGTVTATDADGELLLLCRQNDAPILWKVGAGKVILPDGIDVAWPLTANTFVTDANTTASRLSVYRLDGTVVAENLSSAKPLTSNKFIACTAGYANDVLSDDPDAHNFSEWEQFKSQCGVMGESGQWLVPAAPRSVSRLDDGRLLFQTKGDTQGCIINAGDSAAHCDDALPVPTFDTNKSSNTKGRYFYARSKLSLDKFIGYEEAEPFYGNTAVAVQDGLPGLIDMNGKWITPRLTGSAIDKARRLMAAAHQVPGRLPSGRFIVGSGLIDRTGHSILPPVFQQLRWYVDHSLQACPYYIARSAFQCWHISVRGAVLDPASSELLPLDVVLKRLVQAVPETISDGDDGVSESNDRNTYKVTGNDESESGASSQWLSNHRFRDAGPSIHGRAIVKLLNGSYAYLQNGDITPLLDAHGIQLSFPDAPAPVQKDSKYGYQEADKTWAIEPRYLDAEPFFGNLAIVVDKQDAEAASSTVEDVVVAVHRLTPGGYAAVTFADGKRLRVGIADPQGEWLIL